jgi:hypothetical protein
MPAHKIHTGEKNEAANLSNEENLALDKTDAWKKVLRRIESLVLAAARKISATADEAETDPRRNEKLKPAGLSGGTEKNRYLTDSS